ncbi:MAG TPA: amidohydrolase [Symbiobacteriaceae bacterium]|nr:amidohydrolase [Symbiobacteriaceae bacterium]
MQAEWILMGGPVLSGHTGWRSVEAVAVAGGKVIAFGTRGDVMAACGPGTQVIDLHGRAVIPGLIDAHLHILGYAMTLDTLAVAGLPSLEAVRKAVADQVVCKAEGEWIVGRGWDQDRWLERREPNRHDLDRVAPGNPVYLQRNCNHLAVVNTAALRLAGITRETPDPPGGQIDRDPETGEPTGMLRENAQALIQRIVPEMGHERRRTLLRLAMREALSYGITGVHTDDVDRAAGGFEQADDLFRSAIADAPIRVTQMIPGDWAGAAAERGIVTGAGDEWYRYGQVKMFADGSLGGRTAALLEPYSDDPSTRGIYIHGREAFIESVSRIHALGDQVGCHCIGDGAATLFVDAVEEAQRRAPRPDARHRMIHAQILNRDLMHRMRQAGIVADIQPVFMKSDGYWFAERVGVERARTSYAWKSLYDLGVNLCGGSDCPIEPLNIWYGIHCAVNRQDLNGYPAGGWNPAERLSVAEALHLYTTGASYATFQEGVKGTLAPGMAADLVVLDRNPFACDPAELKEIKVDMTMVGGRITYQIA